MPIYEYECGACGHRMEAFQKMSDAPLSECPSCQKPDLHKLISAGAFQLKGTGWYATDFRNKGKPETTTDSKTDAKTDTKSSQEESKGKNDTSSDSKTGSATE